ncbi:adenylate/guanylate cyclase domain-containing protein [Candidatus Marinimicrobia bacterium MT.SAG.3]|nr:adenylate/guanylate cyclase domain-containing protein [Candidatus Marinimicrobia bacterium MT.SAG.3]
MPSEPKRKLAAIMFTDMVGYTSLMQKDEGKARKLIERHRDLMKPHIDKHGGEIIQYVGDGTFCRFDSAIEAVNAALEIQHVFLLEDDMSLRIGIHVGDVVIKGDEVYGDGVNVASRLEPLAEAGGICLSGEVYTQIKNHLDIDLVAGGSKELKNVKDPIDIYFVSVSTVEKRSVSEETQKSEKSFSRKYVYAGASLMVLLLVAVWNLPFFSSGDMALEASGEIRSIAVLPLDNLSNDPQLEYFSDGMTEALISTLAQIRSLKVISRTSVMQYKGVRKSLPEIAKELNVDAILEGSVMHAGGEVRITVQLIRASTDEHLWANDYTDKLENVLSLQGRIAKAIAKEIKLTLSPEEELKLSPDKKINVEAHEAFLRGKHFWNKRTGDDIKKALKYFEEAVNIDPLYALAHVGIAESYLLLHQYVGTPSSETYPRGRAAALKALEIDPNLGEAHIAIAYALTEHFWDWAAAETEYKNGLELSPNYATGHQWYAEYLVYTGRFDEAKIEIKLARELDPLSKVISQIEAFTYEWSGDIETTRRLYDKNIELYPEFGGIVANAAYFFYWSVGEEEKASELLLKAIEIGKSPDELINATKQAAKQSGFKGIIKVWNDFIPVQALGNVNFIARNYYLLGEYDKSLDWLELAMEKRDFGMILVYHNPLYSDPVFRSNPRFQAIFEKMNFPNN